jgi:type IV secretory pathway component VirB8
MNKEESKSTIKDLMKSKRYFDAGFHWYFDRYLGFFWQKRLFSFLFFMACIAIFFIFKLNLGILVDSRIPRPVVTYINNYDDIAFIQKLKSKTTKNPNILIANYLVEKYIIIKESYDYNNLDFQKKFLFNTSTSFLFLDYENNISISNPTSPLLVYGKDEILTSEVKNLQVISDDSGLPNKAEADCDLYKKSPGGLKVLLSSYKVKMEFYMNDIYSIKKQNSSDFIFSVLRYSVIKK